MLPLGVLLYAQRQLGSFATGGLMAAALSLGSAGGGVLIGYVADRWGHRLAGLLATLLGVTALAFWVALCRPGTPLVELYLIVALVGFANPQVGSMARARWAHLGAGRDDRESFTTAAMAYEGAVDEGSFVVGPVLVTSLAGWIHPAAGLIGAAVLAGVSQSAFALHSSALPPVRDHEHAADHDRPARIAWRTVAPLAVAVAAVGLVFGGSQTGVSAFFTVRETAGLIGPIYAFMGFGSALMGLATARLPHRFSHVWRVRGFAVLLVAATPLLLLADSTATMAAACLAVGVALAPILVSAFSLAEAASPPRRRSTVMTVMATAGVVGVAIGVAGSGNLIEMVDPRAAFVVPLVGAVLATAAGAAAPVLSTDRG